ncbi:phage tail protein [Paramagnetospirillum magneticum]|uniref:Rcc01698-like C-terminal domain-containing protein n=1 Tax=Paramagnetospirillum magneticum (strain ATCC 700264 / AMB-1) TaxID=342108 RepID=Q2W6E0_PARM1|nr:phage tail protein [Paramagnetospirillum magneticum]BAE50585.1 hypothetical protein amb1781 [Paramagnetospirillum magneticum AMB-1]
MGGLFGGNEIQQPTAAQPTAASGVTIQTSCWGKVKPVVVGTGKLAPNLIWYNDFKQIAHSSGGGGGGGGGKGGGGGGGGGSSTSYTYSCSLMLGLCEGPIRAIGSIWQGNDATATTLAALGYTAFLGAYGQEPWAHLAGYTTVTEEHTVPLEAPYQVTVDYTGAPFADHGVKYGDGTPLTAVTDSPAAGQYAVADGVYTFSAFDAGAEAEISYTAADQQPPSQALGYSGLVHIAAADYDLGSSASLPNHNVELFGFYSDSVPGHDDADPAAFVEGLMTSADWGIAPMIPSVMVGDQSTFSDWCVASGLLISAVYTEQQTGAQVIDDIAVATNTDVGCPNGAITLISRGCSVVTGNGRTYTPPEASFDLTDDDWLVDNSATTSSGMSSSAPLVMTAANDFGAVTQVQVEYLNRASGYNPLPATARLLAEIRTYGLNPGSVKQSHLFALPSAAQVSAQLQLQRAAILGTWAGSIGSEHVAIELGDVGYISSVASRVARRRARVKEGERRGDGSRHLVFEEILPGAGIAESMTAVTGFGFSHNFNLDPGDVTDVVMFDAPTELAGGLEIWLAACGGPNWGGAQVSNSADDVTFARAGLVTGRARIGRLVASLPAVDGLDTTSILELDLSISGGMLDAGSQADFDALATLCWVDGELIAYRDCTLVGPNRYQLSHLRRGLYNTPVTAHAAAASFVRLDQAIYRQPYAKADIGSTVYVKLTSFNTYEGALQTLDEVSSHAHVILGPPRPPIPAGVSAQQAGNVVNFAWTANPTFAMDIAVGPQGCASGVTVDQAWAAMSMVTEAARGSYDANASLLPGAYTFGFRFRDPWSDQLSEGMTTVDLAVTNANMVILSAPQGPAWPGTLSGFLVHPTTGVLIPDSVKLAGDHTNAELFEQFVPYPVPLSTYDTPAVGDGIIDTVRVYGVVAAGLGPDGQGNVLTSIALDWTTNGVLYNGAWTNWTSGTVTAAYVKARLIQDNSAGACVVTGFTPTLDVTPKSEVISAVVPAGGGAVVFAKSYHAPPLVNPGAVGAGVTGATATAVNRTGCIGHVWSNGTDVGGTIILTIGPSS